MSDIILRAETKVGERRTPLVPGDLGRLIRAGVKARVERSISRAFVDEDYLAVGAELVPAGTWTEVSPSTLVLGLKELPTSRELLPLTQKHCYFAHCFKGQSESRSVLGRFREGGGSLYDLEYLVDGKGRRIAAFGYWAGFVGAAVGILAWAEQRNGKSLGALTPWASAEELIGAVGRALKGARPLVGITGHLGRAGRGATDVVKRLGLEMQGWDYAECAGKGALLGLLEKDIAIHCVGLQNPRAPFLEESDLRLQSRRLSVLVDVTCDQVGPLHLFPFYREGTSLMNPCLRTHSSPVMDVIAIDHLPTLLPRESSEEFSSCLLPHLLEYFGNQIGDETPWTRSEAAFQSALQSVMVNR